MQPERRKSLNCFSEKIVSNNVKLNNGKETGK